MILLTLSLLLASEEIPSAALDACNRARALWETRTQAGLEESLELFEQAARIAPELAAAHAGIADAASLLALYGYAPASVALPKARAAAERAIALDPTLGTAHASLGLARYLGEWDWRSAEDSFRRAIALEPDYAPGHHWFAMMLMVTARYEEALGEIEKAIALEPDSALYQTKRGTILLAAGRVEDAEKHLRQVVSRFPDFSMARRELGRIEIQNGHLEQALEYLDSREPDRGLALARLGRDREARSVLATLGRSPVDAAVVHAGLGEVEEALEELESAFVARDPSLVYFRTRTGLSLLRSEPRFREIETRMGLPPSSGLRFAVRFDPKLGDEALDGRLLLLISNDPSNEPRFQIVDGPATQIAFGMDVDGWKPGEEAIFDAGVLGYPLDSLADIPKGAYRVQALLHKYETFRRADGHVVKLPMDRGEGQQWNRAPGNLLSEPKVMDVDPASAATLRVALDRALPAIEDP
ncbi:MAG TPA: tetratricopeptide repeat protein, partial [Vicinamibacteria bacterium]|nr:tetratricopeptide repeat protein [Vicinamibacteria bacterium]